MELAVWGQECPHHVEKSVQKMVAQAYVKKSMDMVESIKEVHVNTPFKSKSYHLLISEDWMFAITFELLKSQSLSLKNMEH